MFPTGLPAGVNLMGVLIQRIRSGEVDLKPGKNDGWYQHQVYALETLLLPAKGQETDKLLLTAEYKKRLVEAFKALITKRRETHARQLAVVKTTTAAAGPKVQVCPRLRIEPCATFYLRNARAYSFLQDFLVAAVGRERLVKLHGLREGGERPATLDAELAAVPLHFYGFYLLSCEDIGMKPQLADGELPDPPTAKQAAIDWLAKLADNADLRCDTRVSVPIFVDANNGKTHIWATLGVRLAHLEASYAQPPRLRPKDGAGPWTEVVSYQLGDSGYVIAVNEFAEIELPGSSALAREELREVCDRYKTKEEIVRSLCAK